MPGISPNLPPSSQSTCTVPKSSMKATVPVLPGFISVGFAVPPHLISFTRCPFIAVILAYQIRLVAVYRATVRKFADDPVAFQFQAHAGFPITILATAFLVEWVTATWAIRGYIFDFISQLAQPIIDILIPAQPFVFAGGYRFQM